MSLQSLAERTQAAQQNYYGVLGQQRAIASQIASLTSRIEEAEQAAESHRKAAAFLTQYGDEREASVHALIENLVSQGLRHVFQEDLQFVVVAKASGSRTVVDFQIVSEIGGEQVATPVLSARGGGVAAVSGFLLQVVVMLLTDAPKVLMLDETFAQVSAEYEPRLADFMSQLADNLGLQILMVTHSDAYEDYADASWRISVKDGKTQAVRAQ